MTQNLTPSMITALEMHRGGTSAITRPPNNLWPAYECYPLGQCVIYHYALNWFR